MNSPAEFLGLPTCGLNGQQAFRPDIKYLREPFVLASFAIREVAHSIGIMPQIGNGVNASIGLIRY